jgi:hypothetical protein
MTLVIAVVVAALVVLYVLKGPDLPDSFSRGSGGEGGFGDSGGGGCGGDGGGAGCEPAGVRSGLPLLVQSGSRRSSRARQRRGPRAGRPRIPMTTNTRPTTGASTSIARTRGAIHVLLEGVAIPSALLKSSRGHGHASAVVQRPRDQEGAGDDEQRVHKPRVPPLLLSMQSDSRAAPAVVRTAGGLMHARPRRREQRVARCAIDAPPLPRPS